MKKEKKWQIPVLLLGVVLLAYFGLQTVKTFRTAGGTASPAVQAKAPDHVKTRPPGAEETAGPKPPTPAVTPAVTSPEKTPVEELAAIHLPAGDILRPLIANAAPPATGPTGEEAAGPEAPFLIRPEIPRATLVVAPNVPGAAPSLSGGVASRVRKGGSGFPMILPERTGKEESIRCLGTIIGHRRMAILTDLSAADGTGVLFVAEGERIPGPKRLVVSRVEPGSVRISTGLAFTTLQVEPESDQANSGGAPGPMTRVPPLR